MTTQIQITTIKPTLGLSVSFQPRTKEGEEKKPEVFASYALPEIISSIINPDLAIFASRAYRNAVLELLKDTLKAGKDSFVIPAIAEIFPESTKREFTVTKEAISEWFDSYAAPLLTGAIASKGNLPVDSVAVVKKVIKYKELMLAIAKRGDPMKQEDIDAAIRVLGLLSASNTSHAYTDNVAQGIAKMQEKLNAYLAGNTEDDGLGEDDF